MAYIGFLRGWSANTLLPLSNEVCEGYVFTRVCLLSTGGGGGVVSPHALQVVSQHALQISRPTPKGRLMGLARRGLQAHTRGSLGPLQAHTLGGRGVSQACTEADPPPTADSYCCGRYASYWNAFLFGNFFVE